MSLNATGNLGFAGRSHRILFVIFVEMACSFATNGGNEPYRGKFRLFTKNGSTFKHRANAPEAPRDIHQLPRDLDYD